MLEVECHLFGKTCDLHIVKASSNVLGVLVIRELKYVGLRLILFKISREINSVDVSFWKAGHIL